MNTEELVGATIDTVESGKIELEDLPGPMLRRIERDLRPRKKRVRKITEFWVTELIDCQAETYYWRTEDVDKGATLARNWAIWRGRLWDDIFSGEFTQHQGRVVHKFKAPDGVTLQISGRYDFIYRQSIGELKTVKNMFYMERGRCPACNRVFYGGRKLCKNCGNRLVPEFIPKNEHTIQAALYAAKKGMHTLNLYYADFGGWARVKLRIKDADTLIKWFEDRATALYVALRDGVPARREESWKCTKATIYCSHYPVCKNVC